MKKGFELTDGPWDGCRVGDGATVDESVSWGRNVVLGEGVHIGPGATLYDNVEIGDGTWIGPGCSIGEPTMGFYRDRDGYDGAPTRIGPGGILRRGTVINAGTVVGDRFQSGPYVAIREETRIGSDCSVGNNCDIQYGVEIGDFTRLHSNVAVGSGTRIGPFVWVHPFVVFTNDRAFPAFFKEEPPVVAPFCSIAVHSTILPGARLGVHTIVGAHTKVGGDVPAFAFMDGSPAENRIDCRRILHKIDDKPVQPYPWIRHVDRDYPWADTPAADRRVEDWVPDEWKDFL
ncbi:MAG: N-acetyltransferase [Acidobacteria bacterium]|nr:N-acetyltransferase [Acidobacteriota bacterium]